ncbi:Methylenetetrahydrofolate dehydrogenase [NAD(+)] [Rhodotorula toruloides]|uniref:Methylenetetrahydrofolate dehydrogenase n=1 Tax=Rhodotorula toruloides TaxID=5286 RepID=A0A0K3CAM5_RHOTO|nr:methylenetetrahydrofolate dehydrogenase [Rhodotorula toruloides]
MSAPAPKPPADPTAISCVTVLGEHIAKPFRTAIQEATSKLAQKPKLVGILANSGAPSRAYANWTAKACEAVGIEYELREVGIVAEGATEGTAEQGEVEEAILAANEDDGVNGIMVYYPIFGPRQDGYLQQAVSPLKDVEGLNFTWLFSLYHNIRFIDPRKLALAAQVLTPSPLPASASSTVPTTSTSTPSHSSTTDDGLVKAILPCTPLAIVKTLEHCQVYNPLRPYGSRAFGRTITVVNRSEVVGRPLAALLSNDGARVFSVDLDGIQEFTRRKLVEGEEGAKASFHPYHVVKKCELSFEECLKASDVVIGGVPSKSYKIPTSALKEGVVAINFSESKNFEDDIKEKASIYCPGIGKATIVLLQRNLLRLREYQASLRGEVKGEKQ